MVDPEHCGGGIATEPKLQRPKYSPLFFAGREPVAVKCHVARFVTQDQRTHLFDWQIVNVPSQDSVIGGADKFGEQQDLEFSAHSYDSAAGAKGAETPVGFNSLAGEPGDGLAQKA